MTGTQRPKSTARRRVGAAGVHGSKGAPGWRRVSVVAVTATVASILPAFLAGALGVQIADDLQISAARFGLALGTYFIGASTTSSFLGRVAERTGPERALRISTAASAALMVAIALTAGSFVALVALLTVCGAAQGLGQPAANLLLARGTPPEHQGVAFAIKQSGMPAGTLIGGAAVPLVGLTLGWEWAFVGGAGLAMLAFAFVPPARTFPATSNGGSASRPVVRPSPMGPLVLLASAVGFGAASAGALVGFYVSGGVDVGLSESVAGWALTVGSAFGIAMRVWQGVRADQRGSRHLPVVSTMLAIGVVGYLLLATGEPGLHLLAIPLAFGAGWAWPGLFNLAVVRNYALSPGAATGISQTGTYLGAMTGPIVFGAIVDAAGYSWAWLFAGLCAASASAMMLIGRSRLVTARARESAAD